MLEHLPTARTQKQINDTFIHKVLLSLQLSEKLTEVPKTKQKIIQITQIKQNLFSSIILIAIFLNPNLGGGNFTPVCFPLITQKR